MKSCLECRYHKKSYPDGDTTDPLFSLECGLTGEDVGYGDNFPVPPLCPLTEKGCLHHHKKTWNWIADETERNEQIVRKDEYLDHIGATDLYCNCYCCTYAKFACNKCPIQWGTDGNHPCFNRFSPYKLWKNTEDWKTAAILARTIAQLPERKEENNNGSNINFIEKETHNV